MTAPSPIEPSAARAADVPSVPWSAVGADRVRLLMDGNAAFPAMLAAIAAARREVLVEMYWFAADAVGTRMRDALAAAARRGVQVRVIYDGFGSLNTPERFWKPITDERTGSVRLFGAVAPWQRRFRLGSLLNRDHRKLVVVDGARAFVGGLNVGNEWWPQDGGRPWRDDVIELEGPTAPEVRSLFWRTWRRLGGSVPGNVPAIPPEGNGLVWLIANDRRISSRREIRRTYLQQIRRARRSIDLANAYFLPDPGVRRALIAARRRGVPVRVLIPERSDVPHMGLAQLAEVSSLLGAGIQVFAYRPVVFHSKTAIIDDFVTVGSYNLDHRSWRFNLECNIAVFDTAFADTVRAMFEDDLRESMTFTEERLASRPWPHRAASELCHLVRFLF